MCVTGCGWDQKIEMVVLESSNTQAGVIVNRSPMHIPARFHPVRGANRSECMQLSQGKGSSCMLELNLKVLAPVCGSHDPNGSFSNQVSCGRVRKVLP